MIKVIDQKVTEPYFNPGQFRSKGCFSVGKNAENLVSVYYRSSGCHTTLTNSLPAVTKNPESFKRCSSLDPEVRSSVIYLWISVLNLISFAPVLDSAPYMARWDLLCTIIKALNKQVWCGQWCKQVSKLGHCPLPGKWKWNTSHAIYTIW